MSRNITNALRAVAVMAAAVTLGGCSVYPVGYAYGGAYDAAVYPSPAPLYQPYGYEGGGYGYGYGSEVVVLGGRRGYDARREYRGRDERAVRGPQRVEEGPHGYGGGGRQEGSRHEGGHHEDRGQR